MLILITATVLGAGLSLLAVGLRGRRADDHPLCRRCRFDLTGRPADAERRCPECGADLAKPRAVFVGHRKRRAGLAVAGGMVVAVTVGGAVLQTRGMRWREHAPLFVMRWAATVGPTDGRTAAVAELARRWPTLGDRDHDGVADAGLAYQGDRSRPWVPAWGDLLESARTHGQLSDDRWRRYAAQAPAGPTLALRVRARVARGDRFVWAIGAPSGRVGSGTVLVASAGDLRLSFDGGPPVRVWWEPQSFAFGGGGGTQFYWQPGRLPRGLVDGEHTVRLTGAGSVDQADAGWNLKPVVAAPVDVTARFTLLPTGQPSVTLVSAPPAAVVARCVSIALERHGMGGGDTFSVTVTHCPVGLAFDVLARPAGNTAEGRLIGQLAVPPVAGSQMFRWGTMNELPPGPRLDVTLRSSRDAAAKTVDVFTAWTGRLDYPGVPAP